MANSPVVAVSLLSFVISPQASPHCLLVPRMFKKKKFMNREGSFKYIKKTKKGIMQQKRLGGHQYLFDRLTIDGWNVCITKMRPMPLLAMKL